MSLTSVELNYLVWRYLQESGFELAAYALDQSAHCRDYVHPNNPAVDMVRPGTLANLVQKGILYVLLDDAANELSRLHSLVEALVRDHQAQEAHKSALSESRMDTKNGGKGEGPGASGLAKKNRQAKGEYVPHAEFSTASIVPVARCAPSLAAAWHPSTAVFAVGLGNLTAAIHALGTGVIAESVRLNHPLIMDGDSAVANAISLVAWHPQGSMLVTAGADGEMRAWSPDGRLENVANSLTDLDRTALALIALAWNPSGLLAYTIDAKHTLRVWDGATLSLLHELREPMPAVAAPYACWLGDRKFAVSTAKNTIKIYSVGAAATPDVAVLCVGQLAGHTHVITSLAFSATSRLLTSLSDVDYAIKVWNSQSAQDAIELNVALENLPHVHYHTTPIIGTHWLSRPADVQDSVLLTVSMEGTVNIWDAFTGDALVSANVFQNPDNFRFADDQPEVLTKNSLVFASAVSPNGKYLALGDDVGNVSMWDVLVSRYADLKDTLRCLAIYGPGYDTEAGICDLVWDHSGRYLCVSYQGTESAVFEWDRA
ncbi:WD40 repeat-like protein [Metschnikowia bicuspidata]|uniref:WD40 repeat-like protein n=1 Tax=Metschnikowia bicuspidata TaxID=27322 RepID=A0A4V1J3C0_9ASCO|nr:WD40 repeat-like protein [Metschnikowia bicuspidata]